MNYFFVFIIQTLLPFSLLLACSWVAYPHANFKKLAWLSIFSFIIGSVITLNLPNSQNVKLALAIFSLCILLFAYFSQFIHWQRLNTFWHIMLAIFPLQKGRTRYHFLLIRQDRMHQRSHSCPRSIPRRSPQKFHQSSST